MCLCALTSSFTFLLELSWLRADDNGLLYSKISTTTSPALEFIVTDRDGSKHAYNHLQHMHTYTHTNTYTQSVLGPEMRANGRWDTHIVAAFHVCTHFENRNLRNTIFHMYTMYAGTGRPGLLGLAKFETTQQTGPDCRRRRQYRVCSLACVCASLHYVCVYLCARAIAGSTRCTRPRSGARSFRSNR